MQSPKRLDVYQHAKEIAVAVYQITDAFPYRERFGLTIQMRRAAVSIGSNIAEGCGRRGNRELLQFLYVAAASASELAFQLELAAELGFGDASGRASASGKVDTLQRMLNRLTSRMSRK